MKTWIVFSIRKLVFGIVQTREDCHRADVVALIGSREEVIDHWFVHTATRHMTLTETDKYIFH